MKGMTSGGHLVMYDSLHLTEHIRAYDCMPGTDSDNRGSYATNKSHAIDQQLICMMLALPNLIHIRGNVVFNSTMDTDL